MIFYNWIITIIYLYILYKNRIFKYNINNINKYIKENKNIIKSNKEFVIKVIKWKFGINNLLFKSKF